VIEGLSANKDFTQEETRAQLAVKHHQEESRNQYRERKQTDDSRYKERPDGQRHTPHAHPFGPQV
jgi:hypothetical protein